MLQPDRTACNSATIVAVRLRPCCSLIERHAAAQLLSLQPNRTACSSTATVAVRLRPCCNRIEQRATQPATVAWLRADVARGKWCRREQERGHHVDQPCKLCKLHDSARAPSFSSLPATCRCRAPLTVGGGRAIFSSAGRTAPVDFRVRDDRSPLTRACGFESRASPTALASAHTSTREGRSIRIFDSIDWF